MTNFRSFKVFSFFVYFVKTLRVIIYLQIIILCSILGFCQRWLRIFFSVLNLESSKLTHTDTQIYEIVSVCHFEAKRKK